MCKEYFPIDAMDDALKCIRSGDPFVLITMKRELDGKEIKARSIFRELAVDMIPVLGMELDNVTKCWCYIKDTYNNS